MAEKKRVNIRMSDEIVEFYDDMADSMGVSRSYVMVMALKSYMDQQKAMSIAPSMVDVIKKYGPIADNLSGLTVDELGKLKSLLSNK